MGYVFSIVGFLMLLIALKLCNDVQRLLETIDERVSELRKLKEENEEQQ